MPMVIMYTYICNIAFLVEWVLGGWNCHILYVLELQKKKFVFTIRHCIVKKNVLYVAFQQWKLPNGNKNIRNEERKPSNCRWIILISVWLIGSLSPYFMYGQFIERSCLYYDGRISEWMTALTQIIQILAFNAWSICLTVYNRNKTKTNWIIIKGLRIWREY